MRKQVLERFLKYVTFDTKSDPKNENSPSTEGQMVFAKYLVEELKGLGLEASVDENSYVMATLKGNKEGVDTIGFISHLDTSPEVSGKDIKARIVENYDGKDIVLNDKLNVVTYVSETPELERFIGEDIVVTDGTTLLGSDDKAGIAEIVTAIEYLTKHPEIEHGDVKIAFTPDEELGRGTDFFDVEKFGAKCAYTLDGAVEGELQYENFNAAAAVLTINGKNVHPGAAKNKMVNAMYIAGKIMEMIPENERPETTEGYEGFYHLTEMNGNVDTVTMEYIIRDHDNKIFEDRKEFFKSMIAKANEQFEGRIELKLNDQYFNMKEQILPVMYMVDIAEEAMNELDIKPIIVPERGGTDGAMLSYKGLPCPNLFTGGVNFHGKNEFVPVSSMEKATKLVVRIVEKFAARA